MHKNKYRFRLSCYFAYFRNKRLFPTFSRKNTIINNGFSIFMKKDIRGRNNKIVIGKQTKAEHLEIHIYGSNNKLLIGEHCFIGKGCNFWIDGNDNEIVIGDYTTFTHSVHLCAQEHNTKIEIGTDCMFANNIIVRNSDSHPIYSLNGHKRLNEAQNVKIGNHVWIATKATVMKGVTIGDGAIVGYLSVVTKDVASNTLVVGTPAKVVKENIEWTRDNVAF